jgi:hypothetical protein
LLGAARRGGGASIGAMESTPRMRVVVLGGYGNFGARICRALAGDAAIGLVVAGRDGAKAAAFAAGLPRATAAPLDTAAPDFASRLAAQRPALVIHTAGPFQGQAYGVAEAVAAAGAHYIDLADGRRFVCDFAAALDARFRTAGCSAVAGTSSVPALSSAVVDHHRARFAQLHAIQTCIAPAQQAPRGVATLAAVLSYCGEPIRVWRGGGWRSELGWADPRPQRFARMAARRAALCDIPDLELFPQRYAGVPDVHFGAALEVGLTQQTFAALSWLRARRLLPSPSVFAGALHRMAGWFDPLGSGLGGMVVRLCGLAPNGRPLAIEWHLSAGGNHGPEIPCMPAILLARRLARGEALPLGAQPCLGLLRLAEFEPEFARWGMQTDLVIEGG